MLTAIKEIFFAFHSFSFELLYKDYVLKLFHRLEYFASLWFDKICCRIKIHPKI